ncbi:MAG: methylmalonyl-CoA epimerase [Chloroflexi bacterium]|nr:methylmalonyl-CoA epimerase [Chloroflexota bacterium]
MSEGPVCLAKHINHVCIAVKSIEKTLGVYGSLFGIRPSAIEDIPDQGVRGTLIPLGGSQLEIIEPIDPNGGVARFIEKRGEGLHHICFEVDNVAEKLKALEARGVELIDRKPRKGLAGMIGFIHPRSMGGVLVELAQRVEPEKR